MYEGADPIVRDPKAWQKVGLEFIDNGDYMDRLLAYLKEHVDEEMAQMGKWTNAFWSPTPRSYDAALR